MAATGWLVGAIEINVSINSLVTVVTAFAQHLTPYSSTVLPARGGEGQGNKAESRRRENAFSLPWLNTAQHPSGPEPVLGPRRAGRCGLLGKVAFLPWSIFRVFHHHGFCVCRQAPGLATPEFSSVGPL